VPINLNTSKFFVEIQGFMFHGRLSSSQKSGTLALLDAWDKYHPNSSLRFIAYALATAYWETDRTMQPIAEYGHGAGRPYGRKVPPFDQAYYGRGFVQLTWQHNYERAGKEIGEDLAKNPELALKPEIAARIMIRGMLEGWFTTRKLDDFFNAHRTDWLNARTIINGHDHAAEIAGYASHFYTALNAATFKPQAPAIPSKV
jgi:hypothetical protein